MIATAHNHFTLLLRNELRLYLRGGLLKGTSLVFFIISQVLLHLLALFFALAAAGPLSRSMPSGTTLFMLSGGLLGMFMLMTSRALAGAVQALYTRGDLDLLLSSPVDRQAMTGVRMGAIALTVAMEVALLVWPFANVFVLFGHVVWFKAYLLVPAMAMLATSVGLVLTLLSFRTLGPRRTRVVVQVLAVMMGMGIMLAVYLPRMLAGNPRPDSRSMSTGIDMVVRQSGAWRELLATPAQWVMNGFMPTLAFLAVAAVLLFFTIRLAGDRIVQALMAISGGMVRKARSASTASKLRYSSSFRAVIVVKELKLIARDPFLIAQLLQHSLFALPLAFGLWQGGAHPGMPLPWLAVIVLAAALAAPLSWITITAEDAPDLLAVAPVSRAALIRAKIEAALLPVLPICVLPMLFLARTNPWFASCVTFSAAAAALSAALINMRNPTTRRRDSFKTRHKGAGFTGFLEVISMLFWMGFCVGAVLAGRALAGWR